jgi:hypothetical protein
VCDRQHQHACRRIIDAIDHAPITNAISKLSSKLAAKTFDVVVPVRLSLQLSEASRQFLGQGAIRRIEERLGLRR